MSLNMEQVVETLFTVVASTVSVAAVVRRVLNGPAGKKLAAALTEALGELVAAKLKEERPKLLAGLRAEVRAMVRQETESIRERLAHLEGKLGIPLPPDRHDEEKMESPRPAGVPTR